MVEAPNRKAVVKLAKAIRAALVADCTGYVSTTDPLSRVSIDATVNLLALARTMLVEFGDKECR